MNPADWEKTLLDATERVRLITSRIYAGSRRSESVGIGAAGDVTTVADKAAEDELIAAIARGGARVLSEEAGYVGSEGSDTLAVVDPLDGSSNFERGIPFFCASAAIIQGGEVVLGVVRDLVSGDAYAARKGKGARMNGKPIASSGATDPAKSIVALDLSRTGKAMAESLITLESKVARVVHYGANALELCYLAEGRVDGFVDLRGRMRVTDLAAALLIAEEAGAKLTTEDGKNVGLRFDLESRYRVVGAASPSLHMSLVRLIGR